METCAVLICDDCAIVKENRHAGHGDGLRAEWLSLFVAINAAHELGWTDVEFLGDNASVIDICSARIIAKREDQKELLRMYIAQCDKVPYRLLTHVRRELNLAGRYLEHGNSNVFKNGLAMLEGIGDIVV